MKKDLDHLLDVGNITIVVPFYWILLIFLSPPVFLDYFSDFSLIFYDFYKFYKMIFENKLIQLSRKFSNDPGYSRRLKKLISKEAKIKYRIILELQIRFG